MDITKDSKLREMSQSTVGDGKGIGSIQSLLSWNDLVYTTPKINSLVSMRNVKEYYGQRQEYKSGANDQIVFNIQTGSQYVDMKNSMLDLQVKFDTVTVGSPATTASWGIGSVFNLFREITITTRSGTEVDRYQVCNLHRAHYDNLNESSEWFDSVGLLMGYGAPDHTVGDVGSDAHYVRYLIPMSKLCPLFSADKLLPSHLISGMRIEIQLERTATVAVFDVSDSGTSYTIKEPRLLLDTHLLNDGASSELQKISAKNGLEVSFPMVYTESDVGTTNTFNVEINKAVGRALDVFAITRPLANLTSYTVDSFQSDDLSTGTGELTRAQYRLGSMYFPNREMKSFSEAYYHMLYANRKLSDQHTHPTSTGLATFKTTLASIWASLESLALLKYSGSSINNSRSLSLSIQYAGNADRQIDVFLSHLATSKSFLNNTILKS